MELYLTSGILINLLIIVGDYVIFYILSRQDHFISSRFGFLTHFKYRPELMNNEHVDRII